MGAALTWALLVSSISPDTTYAALDTSAATTSPTTTVQIAPATAVPATAPATAVPATACPHRCVRVRRRRPRHARLRRRRRRGESAAKITPKVVRCRLGEGNCPRRRQSERRPRTTIRVVDCSEEQRRFYYSGRYPASTFDATKISTYANDTCLAQFANTRHRLHRCAYHTSHVRRRIGDRDNDRDVVCVAFERGTPSPAASRGAAMSEESIAC